MTASVNDEQSRTAPKRSGAGVTFGIIVLVIVIAAFPMFFNLGDPNEEEPFGGADGAATEVIEEGNPDYEPWFEPIIGELPGEVLIQTRDAGHYCWQYVQRADYEGFYAAELARRRKYGYPPFVRLALVRLSYEAADSRGPERLALAGRVLREAAQRENVRLLGPAPAPLALLRGRRRYHCLLKGADWQGVRRVFAALLREREAAHLRPFLDLDPVNML